MKKIHLKPIEEVYPDTINSYWKTFSAPYDYRPMIESMAEEVLLEVKENEYSGYSRFLLKDKNMYGYLMFGWGSCSGCDELLACKNYEDIHKLRKQLYKDIRWETKDKLLKWIKNHDWEGDAAGNTKECSEFAEKSIAIMEA